MDLSVLLITLITASLASGRYRSGVLIYPDNPLRVVKASNHFAFSLSSQLPRESNLFFSPMSASVALAMLYLGTGGVTEKEMRSGLGYDADLEPESIHRGFKQIIHMTGGNQQTYELLMANTLLIQQGYEISNSYKDQILDYYNASIHDVGFANDGQMVLKRVNAWASWKTNGKISSLLKEPVSPLTRLLLLNAIYFKGTWKTRFDQRLTMPDTFYNEGKIPKTVPMMRIKKKFPYSFVTKLDSYALELPYDGLDINMLLILPEKRDGVSHVESLINQALLEDVIAGLREVPVQVTLPRFHLEEEYDLVDKIDNMGMRSLFDQEKADLSGITHKKGLYVTKMLHKSVIDVNEEGSEAATITGVAAGVRIGGPLVSSFTADHPFLFFIRDSRTGLILFMGRVSKL